MKTTKELKPDVDTFTRQDLFHRAAAHKGLALHRREGSRSALVKTYPLDNKLLAALAERGINRIARPECNHRIFTLIDENPQKKVPGWMTSNYWNFKLLNENDKSSFNPQITLNVNLEVNTGKRGVEFWPEASGTFVSPADHLPNFRMFKALTEMDDNAPDVAKELSASGGSIVTTWTALGLDGLRRLGDLFTEFAGSNETVLQLGQNREVFRPIPYSRLSPPDNELFVVESAQSKLIQIWRAQLNKYRAYLIV